MVSLALSLMLLLLLLVAWRAVGCLLLTHERHTCHIPRARGGDASDVPKSNVAGRNSAVAMPSRATRAAGRRQRGRDSDSAAMQRTAAGPIGEGVPRLVRRF
jgi:hypothetical protein